MLLRLKYYNVIITMTKYCTLERYVYHVQQVKDMIVLYMQ